MQRNVNILTKIINNYLERNSLNIDNLSWEIKKSELGGFGLFAKRAIEIGELILIDFPIILGPRTGQGSEVVCVNCYKKQNLKSCVKKCGLQVCSIECQNSFKHQKECKIIREMQTESIPEELSEKLTKVLFPIRSLLLSDEDKEIIRFLKAHVSDQNDSEVNIMKSVLRFNIKEDDEKFMRYVCCVVNANAFEVIVGDEKSNTSVKALYSLGSLINHSCTPNTIHVFDDNQYMVVRASKFIPKGAEIFFSYSRFIWGTPTRQLYLSKTKHFLCQCQRCKDPTEFGSYISAVFCKSCKTGKVIPLKQNTDWQCDSCGKTTQRKEIAALSSIFGSILNSFSNEEVDKMLKFIEQKLTSLVPETNETVVQLKYRLICILGHAQDFTWAKLSDEHLTIKEKFCKDLLTLLETLRLGQCKMRGSLLYELYCTYNEQKRRQTKSKIPDRNLLLEAADILMYDVIAPTELKKLWPTKLKTTN